MDSSPTVLAESIRARRMALDNDLERLRVRTQAAHPRQVAMRWGKTALPFIAGAAAIWIWQRQRRSLASLDDLLVHELRQLYRLEMQVLPILERMRDAASNPDLSAVFIIHAEETQVHLERLARVFRSIGAKPGLGRSAAIEAIEQEARRLLRRRVNAAVRDALIVATAQRIEHLEIAGYASCRAHAATLGYTYAADLLEQTLAEERAVDAQLTRYFQWPCRTDPLQ